jgi:hypothetical protein
MTTNQNSHVNRDLTLRPRMTAAAAAGTGAVILRSNRPVLRATNRPSLYFMLLWIDHIMEIPDRYVYGFLTAVALMLLKMYLSAGGFFRRGTSNGNGGNGSSYRKMTLGEMYAAMQAVQEMHSDITEIKTVKLERISTEIGHLKNRVKVLEER